MADGDRQLVRSFRYRLDPAPGQVEALGQITGACRFVYNLAWEQRVHWHGPGGGETAQRREEPLTPSNSLADKGLVEEARRYARWLRDERPTTSSPKGLFELGSGEAGAIADVFDRLANALEARAARALSGEGRE